MRMTNILSDALKCSSILACTLLVACSPKRPDTSEPVADSAPPAATAVTEPVHALITVPVDATAPSDYSGRMAALRQAPGVLNVLVLQAQPAPERSGFQSLAIADFEDEASLEQWMSGEAAKSDPALQVRRADVLAHDASQGAGKASASSFYVVNHYEALVTPADYKVYTEKYVVPNMAHQRSTGAMLAYTMYIEREPEGVKPKAVLVKQYVSAEEHVRAEQAKESYKRDVLLKQPEWKQINDTKSNVRNDLTETLALPVS
jgi:hypothetical protein